MQEGLKSLISGVLRDEGLPDIEPVLREIPFEGQMGLALSNIFQVAREAKPDLDKKEMKIYADELAEIIAEKIRNTGEFEKVEAIKGYVNCFFKPSEFTRDLVGRIIDKGEDWAGSESDAGNVMIEYSQPNTHKAFHIGHVRNAVTGAALVRCYRYCGRETIAANYYGDIGSHVFKALWYLEKHDPDLKDAPEGVAERGKWLGEIYADAQRALEGRTSDRGPDSEAIILEDASNKNFDTELMEIAGRWNSRDKNLLDLWNETRKWSLEDFNRIYNELDAVFDVEFFESEVEDEGLEIVDILVDQGIVTVSDGAKIVEIDRQLHEKSGEPLKDKYRVLVLVRADGASLYGSKDLALAKRKFEEYQIDESIYVVGNEQKFYFEQLFQVLRLMGFQQWEKCFHLSYELVMLPGGKISSREGHVVLYDDVIDELRKRALAVVREKNPGLDDEEKQNVSEMVAMGALIFGMLRVDTNKKIKFDFDEVLDFDGRSAPYIQYAGARAMSILRKAESEGIEVPDNATSSDFNHDLLPVEIELTKILARLPEQILKVVKDKKPVYLANYAYDLAVKFSDFYHQCPVLNAEENIRRGRLLMVRAVRTNLEISLGLLGIKAPEVM